MPCEGANIFRDLTGETAALNIEYGGRRGRYRVYRLTKRRASTPSCSSGQMRSRRIARACR